MWRKVCKRCPGSRSTSCQAVNLAKPNRGLIFPAMTSISAESPKRAIATTARSWLRPGSTTTKKRRAIALAIAAAADILQVLVFPAFIEGAGSPLDDALDAVVALALLATLGFR